MFRSQIGPVDVLGDISAFIDKNKEDVLFLYNVEGEKTSFLLRTDKSNKKIRFLSS